MSLLTYKKLLLLQAFLLVTGIFFQCGAQHYKVRVNDGKYLYKVTSTEKIILYNKDSASSDPKTEKIDRNHMLLMIAEASHPRSRFNLAGHIESYTLIEEKVLDSGLEDFKEINSKLKGKNLLLSANKAVTEIQLIDSVTNASEAKSEYALFSSAMNKLLRPTALKNKVNSWSDSVITVIFQVPGFEIQDTCAVQYKVSQPFVQGNKKLYQIDYSLTHYKLSGYDKSSRSQGLDVTLSGDGTVKGTLIYYYETGMLFKATEEAIYLLNLVMSTSEEPISKPVTFTYKTVVSRMEE